MTSTDDTTAAGSANHWNQLANSEDERAEWDASRGHDTASHAHRARTYRSVAWSLALEAITGVPHCSTCFGAHPSHRHNVSGKAGV